MISCLRKDWPLRREANDLLVQCMKHDADFNISYPIEDDLVFLDDVVADLTKSSKNGEERKVTITTVMTTRTILTIMTITRKRRIA